MMYLALAPRSSAVVGTIVELSEKIVKTTTIMTLIRWLRFLRMPQFYRQQTALTGTQVNND
jgi:hypothetical protein